MTGTIKTTGTISRGPVRPALPSHGILQALRAYVDAYEQLWEIDLTWRLPMEQAARAEQSILAQTDEWRGWVGGFAPYAEIIRTMTQVLPPQLDSWPKALKASWIGSGKSSAAAIDGVEAAPAWTSGPANDALVHLRTLRVQFRAARDAAVRTRTALLVEIRSVVNSLEQLLPG